jgi:hypothetical protein
MEHSQNGNDDLVKRQAALERSRMLLAKFSYEPAENKLLNIHDLTSCMICKKLLPNSPQCECKLCSKAFCLRHKAEINHNCEKLTKERGIYLHAKNLFKMKLKEVKSKA